MPHAHAEAEKSTNFVVGVTEVILLIVSRMVMLVWCVVVFYYFENKQEWL